MIAADATLDEIRRGLALRLAENAAFDGWNESAILSAAKAEGVDPDVAALAFPGGAIDMIAAWFAHIDAEMEARVPDEALAGMKIRERIAAQVEARLDALAPDREALRRALTLLAMPQNAVRAARLGWHAADLMWRRAGDTATDYNHYTKRTILGGVYAATIAVFLDDESENHADTRAFLDRRIDGILRFEKAKARFTRRRDHLPSLSRFIGRLRYPVV
ncbi:MAG TPA: COQ9 family protein [Sphingomonas sp.]